MGRFLKVWDALQPRQRLIAALALMAVAASVLGLVQAVRAPSLAPAYSGLDPAALSEVTAAAQAMGVAVEIQNGTLMVPASERDRVRMALAAQGLPRNGPAGYEILDGLDGFGTTSEMFEATYWRAMEGELARTILATPGVRAARVHIAHPAGRPFQRAAKPSASVTVTMGSGALSPRAAEAIRYLTASAVAGLDPESVSVIDAANGAVLRPGEGVDDVSATSPGGQREERLRAEIERLLAARVGPDKAIVTVSVDTDMQAETVVERVIDPETRMPISTETRAVEETAQGKGGGAATVASNLPQGDAGGGGESSSARTETEERVNFEMSELTRETVKRPGEIRRITVAVLVDGVTTVNDAGERVWAPRPEAELEQLRQLVRSAVGFDEGRGDVVTVETLEFADRPEGGTAAESGLLRMISRNGPMLFQTGALMLTALGLALFVLRPLLRAAEAQPAELADTGAERLPPQLDFQAGADEGADEDDQVSRLRAIFADKREDGANVIRAWLERDVQRLDAESDRQ